MKTEYPNYLNLKDVFDVLSKGNQKIIKDFLDYCSITAKENSIKKIFHKIVQIADIFEKDLDKINLEDVRKFLMLLNKSNRATDTSNDTKKILKRFLRWKYDDWNKRFKDFQDIKLKRKPTSEKLSKEDLLTKEEIEELIRSADKLMYKAMIILFFESGGRPEEIYKLRWKNICFKTKKVKLVSSKTGEARNSFIDQAINRLKLYKQEYPFENIKEEDYVFPSPNNRNEHITGQGVNSYFKTLSKIINKNVYPKLFRNTRLNSLRKKLSPDVYIKFSGHSMETALEHYSHIDSDDVKEEMFERIYNIEELKPEEKEEIKKLKERLNMVEELLFEQKGFLESLGKPKSIGKGIPIKELALK